MKRYLLIIALYSLCWAQAGIAGEADVVRARADKVGENRYTFTVRVLHADTGWDHYADKWDILAPDGTVLGTRILHHPHVHEQPFSRSLTDVAIPGHIQSVTIRAHDSEHGYGGQTVTVMLP